jgi:hypothetical protein
VFDTINVRAKRAKTVDGTTGEVRNLVVDERIGAQVSFADSKDRNESAWRTRHGAMIPSLVAKLPARVV